MATDELNPGEEEEIEIPLNLDEEDEFEVEEDEDEQPKALSDEEKERIALEVHNKKTGKNYKSWEDVAKSEKERDIAFAQNPPEKKPKVIDAQPAQPATKVANTLDADVVEEVMNVRFPELAAAPETRQELKELAELRGESEFSVYKKSSYFQNKAKAESESSEGDERNRSRISSPSVPDGGAKKVVVSKEDVRIANLTFGGDVARYLKYKENKK